MLKSLISSSIALITLFNLANATSITVGFENSDNPPYVISKNQLLDDQHPGIYIELLRQVEKNLKIEIKLVHRPWKRVLSDVKNNKLDSAIGSSFKQERTLYAVYPRLGGKVDPSKSIGNRSYHLYQRKNTAQLWDGTQFTHKKKLFGVMRGYAVNTELKEKGFY